MTAAVKAAQLAALGELLTTLTGASIETGWVLGPFVAAHGLGGEDEVNLNVRWDPTAEEYVAELR